jgi:hypothetical protein
MARGIGATRRERGTKKKKRRYIGYLVLYIYPFFNPHSVGLGYSMA